MDNKIRDYRTKHKRCKWCKYYKYRQFPHWVDICIKDCLLKDKEIKTNLMAKFCKYYELKEEDKIDEL